MWCTVVFFACCDQLARCETSLSLPVSVCTHMCRCRILLTKGRKWRWRGRSGVSHHPPTAHPILGPKLLPSFHLPLRTLIQTRPLRWPHPLLSTHPHLEWDHGQQCSHWYALFVCCVLCSGQWLSLCSSTSSMCISGCLSCALSPWSL